MPDVEPQEPTKCDVGQYTPDPVNCNAYYRCVLGELKKEYCAGNLHFNTERGICDWPESAHCVTSKRKL